MRILHLSDTHLPADVGVDEDGVDARGTLQQLLHDCRHLENLDAVVVSGDVADDGSDAAYRDALALVGTYAAAKGASHIYCVGNHDERTAFQTVLGTGHRGSASVDTGRLLLDQDCCAAVSDLDGLRLITLDSLVPGQTYGQIGGDQLAALTALLQKPSPKGSVVVLHHPPVAIDSDFWRSVNLRDADALIAAVRGGDVRAVLCGHNHLQLSGSMAGVPVWVTPGVVTRIDLTAPPSLERAVVGASATLIDLDAPQGPLFSLLQARDPEAGRQVYLVDAVSGIDAAEEADGPSTS